MLEIGVAVKVIGRLVRVVALHHVVEEVLHQLPVLLGLVQVGDLHGTVDLGAAGGVGLVRQRGQVVPVLGNLPVLVKAEDVKGHLLPRSGEVVDGLEEHIVPVLKGPDVVYRGLDRGGGQVLHRPQEGGLPGAVGQVVLDVVLVQQAGGGLGVAGGEGADEGQRLFRPGHGLHGGHGLLRRRGRGADLLGVLHDAFLL